jgi:hypothetical protein
VVARRIALTLAKGVHLERAGRATRTDRKDGPVTPAASLIGEFILDENAQADAMAYEGGIPRTWYTAEDGESALGIAGGVLYRADVAEPDDQGPRVVVIRTNLTTWYTESGTVVPMGA